MRISVKLQGNLIIFVAIVIFGINIPAMKEMYTQNYCTPLGLTMLRFAFAAVMFWITSLFFPKEKVAKKDMLVILGGGFCGTILNQGMFAYGLGMTSPVDASIIATSSPIFAMLIAAVMLKEPITIKKVGGIFLGAFGAIWLIFQGMHLASATNSSNMLGDIIVFCSQFFYAFYLVSTRPVAIRYSPWTILKWMFTVATVTALPFTWKETIHSPLFQSGNLTAYLMFAFILFGATYIAFMLIPLAQKRIRATTISAYNNLQPLIASFVAIWMGMDTFTIAKLAAAILIFVGVYFVTMSKSREDLVKEKSSTK